MRVSTECRDSFLLCFYKLKNNTKSNKIMAVSYVSKEGLQKMQEELHRLETVERPRISAQIAEAREKGDLSENAEYDAAKEAQG